MRLIREAFKRRAIAESAIDIMMASLSPNTIKQYNSCLCQWWHYAKDKNVDVFKASVPIIISYLTSIFQKGVSYQSLNCHRSSLSLIIGSHIGTDDRIKRWFKGVHKLRPPVPRYNSVWDPSRVLSYMSHWYPLINLNLERLTKKTVMLLVLATGQRVQTIYSIRLNNVKVTTSGVEIIFTDILKTSAPDRPQPQIILPYFTDNPEICPVKTLLHYIEATKQVRIDNGLPDYLFITVKRPHRRASCQSISRWLRQVMSDSGIDITLFSAHSTRHAATSCAHREGLTVDSIIKAVGWSPRSSTFATHYNRPLHNEPNQVLFARRVFSSQT